MRNLFRISVGKLKERENLEQLVVDSSVVGVASGLILALCLRLAQAGDAADRLLSSLPRLPEYGSRIHLPNSCNIKNIQTI
jgi:fatty acid-binding protein DegV